VLQHIIYNLESAVSFGLHISETLKRVRTSIWLKDGKRVSTRSFHGLSGRYLPSKMISKPPNRKKTSKH